MSYRRVIISRTVFFCSAPSQHNSPRHMHPAGFEPASTRLRDGGSPVELRVRMPVQDHPHLGKPWRRRFSSSAISIASLLYPTISHRIALGRIRTFNLRFRRPELLQLSYQCVSIVRRGGIETPTFPLSAGCSSSELTAQYYGPGISGRGIHVRAIVTP